MPESFTKSMGRTHNTAPVMDARKTDIQNIYKYGTPNAIGVIGGFHTAVTAPTSTSVYVTRGTAVGPTGKEVLVATGGGLTGSDYQKALSGDRALLNVRTALGGTTYDALDPATHSILLTIDTVRESLKCHKITSAEKTAIAAAVVDLTSSTVLAFEAATADHVARGRTSLKNPDSLNGAAANTATEFVVAILDKDVVGAGGVISVVGVDRERDVWVDFTALP